MNVTYFSDTDTMYLELGAKEPVETKEIADNLYIDFDNEGRIVALTIEHAKGSGVATDFSYQVVGSEGPAESDNKKTA